MGLSGLSFTVPDSRGRQCSRVLALPKATREHGCRSGKTGEEVGEAAPETQKDVYSKEQGERTIHEARRNDES